MTLIILCFMFVLGVLIYDQLTVIDALLRNVLKELRDAQASRQDQAEETDSTTEA